MDSTANDASNNNIILPQEFSHRLMQLIGETLQPGDSFTIESTIITPNSDSSDDVDATRAPPSQQMNRDEEDSTDDEMPELESPRQEIRNAYGDVAQLLSMNNPFNNILSDPSANIYSTSAPTTRREVRGSMRGNPWEPVFRRTTFPNNLFNMGDVNSDYENFLSSMFLRGLPRSNINSILAQSLLDPSQNLYKNVLSEEGENEIEVLEYKAEDFPEQKSCPMTLMDFKEGDKIAKLPCNHIFSHDAVMKWLKKENSRCPVCRKELASKEVKKDIKVRSAPRPIPRTLNTRLTSRDLLTHIINRRMQQEEEDEIQRAIMASLRDMADD